jgi:hypothetical protein
VAAPAAAAAAARGLPPPGQQRQEGGHGSRLSGSGPTADGHEREWCVRSGATRTPQHTHPSWRLRALASVDRGWRACSSSDRRARQRSC